MASRSGGNGRGDIASQGKRLDLRNVSVRTGIGQSRAVHKEAVSSANLRKITAQPPIERRVPSDQLPGARPTELATTSLANPRRGEYIEKILQFISPHRPHLLVFQSVPRWRHRDPPTVPPTRPDRRVSFGSPERDGAWFLRLCAVGPGRAVACAGSSRKSIAWEPDYSGDHVDIFNTLGHGCGDRNVSGFISILPEMLSFSPTVETPEVALAFRPAPIPTAGIHPQTSTQHLHRETPHPFPPGNTKP